MLLSAKTTALKPNADGAAVRSSLSATGHDSASTALQKAALLVKEGNYLAARSVLNPVYLESRDGEAVRLRDMLDQINGELVFNPRRIDGALMHAVQPGETLTSVAKKYGANWRMIARINGMKDDRLRAGQKLKVLTGLASVIAYKGDFRLALLFGGTYVKEYPIGIGKEGSETPSGRFVVEHMIEKPRWYKPGGGIVEYGEEGNLLGERWIGFRNESGAAGLGIHGTNDEASIKTKCSNGCIRLRNQDVVELYDFVHPGSVVEVKD